ncbi:glutathione S-transferase T3-like [Chenopodium quinoa]|uniref:glutathione S-transferase T3-like n=1 Tax=Chenopodium quinoa TaxID=63459 RepID=UPI000B77E1A2|nr:glutathione S-transferase T3-like [Chenopodium quinoa]
MGNTSLQPPPQHQTPTEFSLENYDNEERTPVTDHGSNTQFDDSQEENVPETPQYPPQVPKVQSNQVAARATRVWSIAEDEALIGLYLQISEDAIKGTNQKATDQWRNVHAAYQMAQAEKPNILLPRPMKSLSSHWRRLAADTLQWISCYDEAGKLPEGGSGYNEADRVKSASKLFHLATDHNFSFPHAVEMLNKDPKWRPKLRWSLSKEERKVVCDVEEQGSAGSGKRLRDDVGDKTPTNGFSSGGIRQLDGVKKAKAKRKGKAVATESGSSDLGEQMKEFATIREREAIMKEKRIKIEKDKEQRKREELDIHKMRTMFDMLQTLKNSPTPLTPQEEAYKNFLLGKLQGF